MIHPHLKSEALFKIIFGAPPKRVSFWPSSSIRFYTVQKRAVDYTILCRIKIMYTAWYKFVYNGSQWATYTAVGPYSGISIGGCK